MEKIVEIAVLFDYYGKLLSKKQYEIVQEYCNNDYSLTELAEINGVSKQSISDILNRTEKKLKFFEKELKHIEKLMKVNSKLNEINESIKDVLDSDSKEEFLRVLNTIYKENESIIDSTL